MPARISVATAHARLKKIYDTFGPESTVYQTAASYVEEHIDDKYLRRDADGNIMGISQSKELKNKEALFGRSYVFDEMLPTVQKKGGILDREITAFKKEIRDRQGPLTAQEQEIMTSNTKTILKDPTLTKFFTGRANVIAADLDSYDQKDGIINEVYIVRDNLEGLIEGADDFHSDAIELLDRKERTADWVREARKLVQDYYAAVDRQDAEEDLKDQLN